MTTLPSPLFDKVVDAIDETCLIAYDDCHKIYLALDEIEAEWFRDNGYITFAGTTDQMLAVLYGWWDRSCALRFISGVRHNADDPNAGFVPLIQQFEDDDEDDDED